MKIVFLGQRIVSGGRPPTSSRAAPASRGSASFPVATRPGSNPPPSEPQKSEPQKSDPPPVAEEVPHHALATEVSPSGIRIDVSGSAGRRLREDSDVLPRLEVQFLDEELRELSPRPGRVRWSRQEGRQATRLGLQFEVPLGAAALRAILRAGQPRPPERSLLRDAVVGLASAALVSLLWYQGYRTESLARERALSDAVASDNAAERARAEALACATERAAEHAERHTVERAAARPSERPEVRAAERLEARAVERPEGVVDAGSNAPAPAREVADVTPPRREEVVAKPVEHPSRQVDGGADAPGEE